MTILKNNDTGRPLKTFLELVKIASPSLKERAVAIYVTRTLKKLGLKVDEDKAGTAIGGESGNIRAVIKGNKAGARSVLLNAHIDTVKPCDHVKPVIKGGYVYSDGTTILGADNKAGVAVMLEAARILKGSKMPHGDVILLFTVAEEIGLLGARHAGKSSLRAPLGFVLDGGDVFEIINQAPSQDSIWAEVIGRSAHAGVRPEDGINAIKVASEAISRMKLGRIDPETTANIGVIEGGIATNIIPEKVVLKGEARSHSLKKLKKQVAHMLECFKKACKKHGARLKFDVTREYDSFLVENSSLAVKLAVNSAKKIGIRPIVKRTGGGSDANIFNGAGLPAVILGVGADRVHTKSERLSIKQLGQGVKFILEIIKGAADGKK